VLSRLQRKEAAHSDRPELEQVLEALVWVVAVAQVLASALVLVWAQELEEMEALERRSQLGTMEDHRQFRTCCHLSG
jgi:hypothetical protein